MPQVDGMQLRNIARPFALMTAFLMLGTLAAPVLAQEQDFYYKRQIAESYTDESAWLASVSHTPEGSDFVVFGINTVGDDQKGLGIGVIYGHGTAPDVKDWAAATFLAPYGIVEYRDNNTDGKFGLRGDDIVSVLPLNKDLQNNDEFYRQTGETNGTVKWYDRPGYKPLEHSTQSVLQVEQITLRAQTKDGVFTIVMHASNSIFINSTVVLSPYEMKLDFIIEDYPYVANDTELALLSIVAVGNAKWYDGLPTDYVEEWQSQVSEGGMNFPIKGGAGYFSWAEEADVDGRNQTVTVSTLAQFAEFKWTPERATSVGIKYIAMSYGRGAKITHDPKLGYVFKDGIPPVLERLVNGSGGLFFVSIVLFVALIAGVRWAKGRSSTPKAVQGPRGGSPPAGPQQPQPPQYPPQQSPQAYHPQQQPAPYPPQQPQQSQQPQQPPQYQYPYPQQQPAQYPYPPQGPQASQPGAPAPGTWAGQSQGQGQQPRPRQDYRPRQP